MKKKNLFDVPLQSVNYSLYRDGKEITQAKIHSQISDCNRELNKLQKSRLFDQGVNKKIVNRKISELKEKIEKLEKRRARWNSL